LGKKQSEIFNLNNTGYVESLVTCITPKNIMLSCYKTLTRKNEIPIIESLPINEKEGIWSMAKDISAGRLGKDGLIELCRCLITLEYFLR
jgi:hypothetical protein